MHLDEIKTKHINELLSQRITQHKPANTSEAVISEGSGSPPAGNKFMALCKAAITRKNKPGKLNPDAICAKVYHTNPHAANVAARERRWPQREQIESALALSKVTEELRKTRASRSNVVFEHIGQEPKGQQRQAVRYEQGGN